LTITCFHSVPTPPIVAIVDQQACVRAGLSRLLPQCALLILKGSKCLTPESFYHSLLAAPRDLNIVKLTHPFVPLDPHYCDTPNWKAPSGTWT